jgi:hypothetical protein
LERLYASTKLPRPRRRRALLHTGGPPGRPAPRAAPALPASSAAWRPRPSAHRHARLPLAARPRRPRAPQARAWRCLACSSTRRSSGATRTPQRRRQPSAPAGGRRPAWAAARPGWRGGAREGCGRRLPPVVAMIQTAPAAAGQLCRPWHTRPRFRVPCCPQRLPLACFVGPFAPTPATTAACRRLPLRAGFLSHCLLSRNLILC